MDYDAKRGDGVPTEAIADDSFFCFDFVMQLRDQTSILLVQVFLRAQTGEVGALLHIKTRHPPTCASHGSGRSGRYIKNHEQDDRLD